MKNSNKNIDQKFIGELICRLKMTSSIDCEYVWCRKKSNEKTNMKCDSNDVYAFSLWIICLLRSLLLEIEFDIFWSQHPSQDIMSTSQVQQTRNMIFYSQNVKSKAEKSGNLLCKKGTNKSDIESSAKKALINRLFSRARSINCEIGLISNANNDLNEASSQKNKIDKVFDLHCFLPHDSNV